MRIACPKCAAAYEVPDQVLAAGPRLLRCTRCGHQFPAAPAELAPPPVPPEPAAPQPDPSLAAAPAPPGPPIPPEPPAPDPAAAQGDRDPPPPTRGLARHSPMDSPLPRAAEEAEETAPRSPTVMAVAWLVSFAILGATGWAAVTWRAAIAEAWPPAARVYIALGLD